jgi:hypothetical protein
MDDCAKYIKAKRPERRRMARYFPFLNISLALDVKCGIHFDDGFYRNVQQYQWDVLNHIGGWDMKWNFATIRLVETDRVPLQEYLKENDNDPENVLQELLSAGLKVSVSYVDDQSAFVVTISGSERSKRNQNWSLSSWSDDMWEAVAMSGYKHFVLCDGKDWADLDKGKSSWG